MGYGMWRREMTQCGGGQARDAATNTADIDPSASVRQSFISYAAAPRFPSWRPGLELLNIYMQCTIYTIDSSSCASSSAGRIMLCIGTPRLMPFPPAMSSAMRDESCAATAAIAMSGIGDLGKVNVCVEGSRSHPRWRQW